MLINTLVISSSTRITTFPSLSVDILALEVTLPVLDIVNVISVVTVYPSGATTSLNVYSSSVFKPWITWVFLVEVHSSTTFPSLSITWSLAPSSSSLEAISNLIIETFVIWSSTRITTLPSWSVEILEVEVTLPSLLTVNLISVVTVYPYGATTSLRVYY